MEAAKLKAAIDEATSKDFVAEVLSELQVSIRAFRQYRPFDSRTL